MTTEQATALIVAVTGLVAAVAAVLAQLRQTHNLMNSRMTELVATTKLAAQKSGELAGRDFEAAKVQASPSAEEQTWMPTGPQRPSNRGTDTPNQSAKTP